MDALALAMAMLNNVQHVQLWNGPLNRSMWSFAAIGLDTKPAIICPDESPIWRFHVRILLGKSHTIYGPYTCIFVFTNKIFALISAKSKFRLAIWPN